MMNIENLLFPQLLFYLSQMDQQRIIIVGTGNLAWHFAALMVQNHRENILIYGRNEKSRDQIAETFGLLPLYHLEHIQSSDFVILAINDDAIAEISAQLPSDTFVIHTSGTTHISAIQQKHAGVVWPIVSLKKGIQVNYNGVPALIETKMEHDFTTIFSIFNNSGLKLTAASSEQRLVTHLAAVIANNLVNDLWSAANDLLNRHALSFDLLLPLIQSHVQKLQTEVPAALQTGPAIRGDEQTMKKHISLLEYDKGMKEIYAAISQHIQQQRKHEL